MLNAAILIAALLFLLIDAALILLRLCISPFREDASGEFFVTDVTHGDVYRIAPSGVVERWLWRMRGGEIDYANSYSEMG